MSGLFGFMKSCFMKAKQLCVVDLEGRMPLAPTLEMKNAIQSKSFCQKVFVKKFLNILNKKVFKSERTPTTGRVSSRCPYLVRSSHESKIAEKNRICHPLNLKTS
jgi:ABC-type antimicrobial peptide transport system ATPase subunit